MQVSTGQTNVMRFFPARQSQGMSVIAGRVEAHLSGDEIARIEKSAQPVLIRCLEGVLWVSQEGDGDDHLLRSGQSLRLERKGLVLVQGMGAENRLLVTCQN